MDIKKIVTDLVREYGTRNPMEISEKLNVLCFCENLGKLNGYYASVFNVQSIHVNERLSPMRQNVTCAHELGHVIMHPNLNVSLMRNTTFMNVDKYEKQANIFASYLLITDECLAEFKGYTIEDIAKIHDIPINLLNERVTVWGL